MFHVDSSIDQCSVTLQRNVTVFRISSATPYSPAHNISTTHPFAKQTADREHAANNASFIHWSVQPCPALFQLNISKAQSRGLPFLMIHLGPDGCCCHLRQLVNWLPECGHSNGKSHWSTLTIAPQDKWIKHWSNLFLAQKCSGQKHVFL